MKCENASDDLIKALRLVQETCEAHPDCYECPMLVGSCITFDRNPEGWRVSDLENKRWED